MKKIDSSQIFQQFSGIYSDFEIYVFRGGRARELGDILKSYIFDEI